MEDIDRFIQGFRRFQENYFGENRELYRQLRRGQWPSVLVIACCDARVDPAILMDCRPGDLFVVRNVANLVPPYEMGGGRHGVSAALEFSVCVLGVEHIVVLGHSHCGGVKALLEGGSGCEGGEFISGWMSIADRAKEQVLRELPGKSPELRQRACEQAAVLLSLENLLTFPWIKQRVDEKDLLLHGWYFDLARGELLAYAPDTGSFETLIERPDNAPPADGKGCGCP